MQPPFTLPAQAQAVLSRVPFTLAVRALSLTPVLIGPPMAALALILLFQRPVDDAQVRSSLRTSMVLAVLNIVLSVMAWRYLAALASSGLLDVIEAIQTRSAGAPSSRI